jgi:hypothetical protein
MSQNHYTSRRFADSKVMANKEMQDTHDDKEFMVQDLFLVSDLSIVIHKK